MTQEQKAKAYDEALDRMKRVVIVPKNEKALQALKETIFPELKESEDERNWKSIERAVRGFITNPIEADELLAWLEKQLNALRVEKAMREVEEKAKAFTEAHKGESADEILAQMRGEEWGEDERIRGCVGVILTDATEQRFTDFGVSLKDCLAWLEKQKINTEGDFARGYDCGYECCLNSHGAEWFEKQREQKPGEWSEEDENMLNSCISSIEEAKENRYYYRETDGDTSYDHEISWLKSLRPQAKQEWSEDDEEMIGNIISSLRGYMCLASKSPYYSNHETHIQKEIEFLNSLRPSWKPSEEQMEAFRKYLEDFQARAEATVGGWNNFDVMIRLYEQLKKLI